MTEETKVVVPDEFNKVIKDFVGDLKATFPEYDPLINKWWKTIEQFNYIDDEEERIMAFEKSETKCIETLFNFCQKKLPPRFFDILYQNLDIFSEDSDVDTEFLPHIHFKSLWQCEITEKTRETIWKYLQLILFSIIGTLNNKEAFGDTAKMFEAINQDEFKTKLEETMKHMQSIFDFSGNLSEGAENLGSGFNMKDVPNATDIHEHITSMLDGKLGKLAREIAEETAANLNMDMENITDMKDVFNNLVQNPTKLMGLVKTVGDKLDARLKSGDLKESELIAEATDIMNRMKNMPGMGNIQSMLSKMGMGDINGLSGLAGLGGKVDVGAMEAKLNKSMKLAKTKERILAKAEANKKAKLAEQLATMSQPTPQQPLLSEEELIKIFSSGETVERTPRTTKPQGNSTDAKKKKKGKK
uniref:Uncharacterized protein n=1 Tax=viral metagenome TaxID=1070528 RepID=A0A6C0IDC6_9ZZZZ